MRTIGWGLCTVLSALLMVGSAGAQAPAPVAGIYVADGENNRIVRMDNMTGAGWAIFGSKGSGTNQFSPMGIFVDAAGKIYVTDSLIADYLHGRIIRIDDMTGAGWTTFGSWGSGTSQFFAPIGIFVDAAGKIYVADNGNSRIVRTDNMTGAGWTTFGSAPTMYPGAVPGTNQFLGPISIFGDAVGKIHVADGGNIVLSVNGGRIVRIDNMTGAGWTTFGSKGSGTNQFFIPMGIFVDAAGKIYVADAFNNRIVRIDNMTGAGWTTFGSKGGGTNQFSGPGGIFVNASGQIFVADTDNRRIVRMDDMTGAGWTTFGSRGDGKNQFGSPWTIFVREPPQ